MTLQYLSANTVTGLSTDAKPTSMPANSVFIETDTRKRYLWSGAAWVLFAAGSLDSSIASQVGYWSNYIGSGSMPQGGGAVAQTFSAASVTPTKATNKVVLMGFVQAYNDTGSNKTITCTIKEGAAILGSATSASVASGNYVNVTAVVIVDNASLAAHTYTGEFGSLGVNYIPVAGTIGVKLIQLT